jgi:hypothetical protein
LEIKLAKLYFDTPDKLAIEKDFAEIHPHKNWILKRTKVEEVEKPIVVEEPQIKSNADGGCKCCCSGRRDFFDMSNFDTIIENYIEQGYRATNIYHYLQLILLERVEELGGFGVGGAGEQLYYTKDNEIHIKINSCYTLGMDWCKRNNTWHQFWFNLTTPEIYAAYMQIDIIKTLLQNPEYFVSHHFASIEKRMVLHRFWPDMVRRIKFSGFEKIEDSYRRPKQAELSHRFPDIRDLFIPISKIQQQLKITQYK